MNHSFTRKLFAACAIWVLACGASLAAKPDDAGKGHGKNEEHKQEKSAPVPAAGYFGTQQRAAAHAYYGKGFKSGKCPPGLAKKGNGCKPPGQVKKWMRGQPLEETVILYPVPQEVIIKMGPPPSGYRYVRVVNDLLLIAIGSRMVVDAIEDLMAP